MKPFVKWAGGKQQLLPELRKIYPFAQKGICKYCEPFVGGGAVLFDILNMYELKEIYISDNNKELINLYKVVQNDVIELIRQLKVLEKDYLALTMEEREDFYYTQRELFNDFKITQIKKITQTSALFIFLNKTCFNGLYRINKKGLFNVPIGSYKKPIICDEENLLRVNKALCNVRICYADYKESIDFIDEKTFVYIDPPYRPLSKTANFTAYSENTFGDNEQKELAQFVFEINQKGSLFVVSNSDPKNEDIEDNFFEDIYNQFRIERIYAKRMINSNSVKRGNITELLIGNF